MMACSVYWVPASSAVSMPSVSSCFRALVTWGLSLLSATRCMRAFSKKGLHWAMTAYVSTFGFRLGEVFPPRVLCLIRCCGILGGLLRG